MTTDFDDMDALLNPPELETVRQLKRPLVMARQVERRTMINGLKKQALNALIPELPDENTDMWIISNGSGSEKRWLAGGHDQEIFDFGSFVPVLCERLGNSGCRVYVSTWVMSYFHAQALVEQLDAGIIGSLFVATDSYFRRREPGACNLLVDGIQRHPGSVFKAWKNHCKLILVATADESKTVVIAGSANLSSQPRAENFTLSTAPNLYHWLKTDFLRP